MVAEISSVVIALKEVLLKALKTGADEVAQMLDDGVLKYVQNTYDKYSKSKTFLFRNDKVDFFETYFPLSIQNNNKVLFTIDKNVKIDELFNQSNCVNIIGNAGSGKTMIMKFIFLTCLKYNIKTPIVIELRTLNSFEDSFSTYVKRNIFNYELSKNDFILKRLLKQGNFIFVLDGFDELYIKNKELRTLQIKEFIDKYPDNYYLIMSRGGSGAESLERFDNYHVNPLSGPQINDFIHQQTIMFEEAEEFEKRIIEVISKPENESYSSYLSSPLLLSMFILTFESYPEIPKYRNKFYFNVFDTLCTRHDAITKSGGYIHERRTKLLNDEIEKILQLFSYQSFFAGKFDFDREYLYEILKNIKEQFSKYSFNIEDLIYDLTVSISIIIEDGLSYKFPHRSLQEYFVANLIKDQQEETKKNIYTTKFKNDHWDASSDLNLWQLCEEIDNHSFLKYVIIENINIYMQQLDMQNESETSDIFRCHNLMKLLEVVCYIDVRTVHMIKIRTTGNYGLIVFLNYIECPINIIHELLRLNKTNCDQLIEIYQSINDGGQNYKAKKGKYIYDFCIRDEKLFRFFKTSGIEKLVNEIYNFMKEKKEEINNLLSCEKKRDNDFLGLK